MITDIGPHRVRHGNVMDTDGITELMMNSPADLMYSDPPWGQGNLNYWSTMNTKMTGAPRVEQPNLEAFMNQLFTLAKQFCRGALLIEYGVKWKDELIQHAEQYGFAHVGFAEPVYGSEDRPLHLHVFVPPNTQKIPGPSYFESLRGTKGLLTVMTAVRPFAAPGNVILDPCCGMGYTAEAAKRFGMHFRGNELNEKRLAKTIARLRSPITSSRFTA